jgi:hypothetical protein
MPAQAALSCGQRVAADFVVDSLHYLAVQLRACK